MRLAAPGRIVRSLRVIRLAGAVRLRHLVPAGGPILPAVRSPLIGCIENDLAGDGIGRSDRARPAALPAWAAGICQQASVSGCETAFPERSYDSAGSSNGLAIPNRIVNSTKRNEGGAPHTHRTPRSMAEILLRVGDSAAVGRLIGILLQLALKIFLGSPDDTGPGKRAGRSDLLQQDHLRRRMVPQDQALDLWMGHMSHEASTHERDCLSVECVQASACVIIEIVCLPSGATTA